MWRVSQSRKYRVSSVLTVLCPVVTAAPLGHPGPNCGVRFDCRAESAGISDTQSEISPAGHRMRQLKPAQTNTPHITGVYNSTRPLKCTPRPKPTAPTQHQPQHSSQWHSCSRPITNCT